MNDLPESLANALNEWLARLKRGGEQLRQAQDLADLFAQDRRVAVSEASTLGRPSEQELRLLLAGALEMRPKAAGRGGMAQRFNNLSSGGLHSGGNISTQNSWNRRAVIDLGRQAVDKLQRVSWAAAGLDAEMELRELEVGEIETPLDFARATPAESAETARQEPPVKIQRKAAAAQNRKRLLAAEKLPDEDKLAKAQARYAAADIMENITEAAENAPEDIAENAAEDAAFWLEQPLWTDVMLGESVEQTAIAADSMTGGQALAREYAPAEPSAAEGGGLDVESVAELVAERLRDDIEAMLGSSSFV